MKINITDWIESGNIYPLNWGDSEADFIRYFPDSKKEIEGLKQRKYPLIILDFVEFYFDKDKTEFIGLNEIIIKIISINESNQYAFFEPSWLSEINTFKTISKKLTDLNISWKIERGPHFNTPNIRINSNILFGFDSERINDNEAELIKIYIQKSI